VPALTFSVSTNFALANFLASSSLRNVSVALARFRFPHGSSNETYHVRWDLLAMIPRQPAGQARFHVCKIRLVLFAPTTQGRRRYRDGDLRARDFQIGRRQEPRAPALSSQRELRPGRTIRRSAGAPLWAPTRLCRTVLAETDPGRLSRPGLTPFRSVDPDAFVGVNAQLN
jgi:hypothetical protein